MAYTRLYNSLGRPHPGLDGKISRRRASTSKETVKLMGRLLCGTGIG